jgi:glutathione S-transferase
MRVIWLCEELGHPYEVIPIDFSKEYRDSPEWRKLNPVGKVPAMTDGDFSMFESGAMLQYLLESYGQGRLQPVPGSKESALYLQWCWFAEATFARPLGDIAQHTVIKPEEDRIPAVIMDATARAVTCLEALENVFNSREYLLGSTFTAADIMMGYSLMLADRFAVLSDKFPAAQAYHERLSQRHGYIRGCS